MNQARYIGMDVHQATISVAVMDSAGKLILESILETKAASYLEMRQLVIIPVAIEKLAFLEESQNWRDRNSR